MCVCVCVCIMCSPKQFGQDRTLFSFLLNYQIREELLTEDFYLTIFIYSFAQTEKLKTG